MCANCPRLLTLENVPYCANVKVIRLWRTQVDKIMLPDATIQNIDECSSLHPAHKMLCYVHICNPGEQPHSSELMLEVGSAVSVLLETTYLLTKSESYLEAYLKKAILVLHCLSLMHCWLTILAYPCNSSEEPLFSSHQQNYKKKKKPIKYFFHVIEMKIALLSLFELVKIFNSKS